MHPDLDFFLEDALRDIQPTSLQFGRVVVEPDYDVSPDPAEALRLREQFVECLQGQTPDSAALANHEGFDVPVADRFRLLKKYFRRITLHGDPIQGGWVEVAPPGNWI